MAARPVAGIARTDWAGRPDLTYRRRQAVDRLMTVLLALATLVGVVVLGFILVYVLVRGLPALDGAFFTQRPLPYGEPGGGVGPALLGSLEMLLGAALLGIPVGV